MESRLQARRGTRGAEAFTDLFANYFALARDSRESGSSTSTESIGRSPPSSFYRILTCVYACMYVCVCVCMCIVALVVLSPPVLYINSSPPRWYLGTSFFAPRRINDAYKIEKGEREPEKKIYIYTQREVERDVQCIISDEQFAITNVRQIYVCHVKYLS